ncbi:uncharacterized protein LTR77_000522 [Saxophila tyrrhenica]|uniref:Aminoglycoside phosphotransferase domain-containing protein n=1 Tax=Saxophila tyrrhenica TaxID=1690608 RepID=A0AAV9PQ45_9PEZI|nr:hypothetical protein LTR77_000522 [Saxophila tyrrhenica]
MPHEYDLTTEDGILTWLHKSEYDEGSEVTTVERLPEGFGGFVYRAHLQDAARASVIVKHAEGYAARAQHWKLDQSRMHFEYEAMDYLSGPEMQSDRSIRTPEVLFYDRKNYVLVMEDAGDRPSVKRWLQPGVGVEAASKVGRRLGRYLARVHDMTANALDVKSRFNGNMTAKYLSGTLYFGGLPAAAEKFGHEDEFLQEAACVGQQEVNEANDVLTLGDFWTGNVLVDAKVDEAVKMYIIDLELSKPGTAEFDIGQMAAEMYCLEVFRDQQIGNRLLQSFLQSYKEARQGSFEAAKVAVRIGVHLVVIMPGAWSKEGGSEQIEQLVGYGVDLIRMGHLKDISRLRESIVGPLMAS